MRVVAVLGLLLCALLGSCAAPPPPAAPTDPVAALRAGDAETALRLATEAAAADPGDAHALRVLSDVAFAAGDYDVARSAAARALQRAPEDPRVRFTALRIQAFDDPAGAVAAAQAMAGGQPRSAAPAVQLADLVLYEAAASGREPAGAAAQARTILQPFAKAVRGSDLLGDYLAVLGNSYLLEGHLAEARRILQEAMDVGVGMPDRVTDLASTLAWIAFQQGDAPAVGCYYDRALQSLLDTGASDAFVFLPKWETFAMLRVAFTGEARRPDRRAMEAVRERMRRQGFRDLLSYREDREVYLALDDAWQRLDYAQAFQLLAWKTPPLEPDAARLGEVRLEPGCFYRKTVAEPSQRLFRPVFLGLVAARSGRPDLARHWYEAALKEAPGNRILRERLAALPAAGPAPADLGAADPGGTVRILQRFARNGWTAPLFDGFQREGVTLAQFEERGEAYEAAVARLDRAAAGLEAGAAFLVEPLARPVPDEEWTDRAVLEIPGEPPFVMHREDGLWVVTGD